MKSNRLYYQLLSLIILFIFAACGEPTQERTVPKYGPTPPDTMVLEDGHSYEVIPIDELFSTFCCGEEESKEYYKSFSFIVKSKLDTLIIGDTVFENCNNLITHAMEGEVYDNGFFLFDESEPLEWYQSKDSGDVVLIKCTIQRPWYQGMLGASLIFENCQIVE